MGPIYHSRLSARSGLANPFWVYLRLTKKGRHAFSLFPVSAKGPFLNGSFGELAGYLGHCPNDRTGPELSISGDLIVVALGSMQPLIVCRFQMAQRQQCGQTTISELAH